MKKVCLLVVLLFSFLSIKSQELNSAITDRNEIKLNTLSLILGRFSVSYEYLLNKKSSIGSSIIYSFDNDFYISPYYRFFFGKEYASGFFLEGFGMFSSIEEAFFNQTNLTNDTKNVNNFGLGAGLGSKWFSNNGIIAEINLGLGLNLFDTSNRYHSEVIGKAGITFGYRF